ncbi:MAG: hypothetical protein PVG45_13520 [Gammaproteobacteria bacterium]
MSERFYIFIVGSILVSSLYLEQHLIVYSLSAWLILESVANIRLPKLLQKARHVELRPDMRTPVKAHRFEFSAIRAWHFLFALSVLISDVLVNQYAIDTLWPLPWILALAALAAGVTTICPLYSLLVYAGFRDA